MDDSSFEEGSEELQGSWASAPPGAPPADPLGQRRIFERSMFTDEARRPTLRSLRPQQSADGTAAPARSDWRTAFRKRGDTPLPRSAVHHRKFLDLVKRIGAPLAGPVTRPLSDRGVCQPQRGPGAAPALSMLARVPS